MAQHHVVSQLTDLIRQELESPDVNIALVSIALGAVETPLTKKDPAQQLWPSNFTVSCCKPSLSHGLEHACLTWHSSSQASCQD